MEKQKISPPRIHSTDPAQPMKRAAPSSNLERLRCAGRWWGGDKKQEEMYDWSSFHLNVNLEYLLLGNKEGVKEVCRDPVSIYGARSHAAEACGENQGGFLLPNWTEIKAERAGCVLNTE